MATTLGVACSDGWHTQCIQWVLNYGILGFDVKPCLQHDEILLCCMYGLRNRFTNKAVVVFELYQSRCQSLCASCDAAVTHTHTHPFNGLFSVTTRISRYQKGKINLDFTGARETEWHLHPQVCTSLQTENHSSTPPLSFLQAGCPSCRPANSVKALKAKLSAAVIN